MSSYKKPCNNNCIFRSYDFININNNVIVDEKLTTKSFLTPKKSCSVFSNHIDKFDYDKQNPFNLYIPSNGQIILMNIMSDSICPDCDLFIYKNGQLYLDYINVLKDKTYKTISLNKPVYKEDILTFDCHSDTNIKVSLWVKYY